MDSQKISAILWFLSALFCLRVLAQLTASVVDTTFLPAFEDWHSATMPYGLLAFFQIVILFFMAKTALRFSRKQVRPSKRTGVFILIIGSIYFFSMVLRMTLGLRCIQNPAGLAIIYQPRFITFWPYSYFLLVGTIIKWLN